MLWQTGSILFIYFYAVFIITNFFFLWGVGWSGDTVLELQQTQGTCRDFQGVVFGPCTAPFLFLFNRATSTLSEVFCPNVRTMGSYWSAKDDWSFYWVVTSPLKALAANWDAKDGRGAFRPAIVVFVPIKCCGNGQSCALLWAEKPTGNKGIYDSSALMRAKPIQSGNSKDSRVVCLSYLL